jgi:hypothetical protein
VVGEGKGIDKSMACDRAIINASGKLDRFMKSSRNLAELNEKTLISNRSVLVGNTVKKDGLNVAIADMVPQGVSMSDAAVVSDWLRGALVANSRYNVVERNEMEKVLAEQAFQQTGCTSQECAVKLGKILNVKRMVVGSFGKFLDAYVLNVRVIDVETGSVIHSDTTKGKTTDEIEGNIKSLAARLSL